MKAKYLNTSSMARIAMMSALSIILGFFPEIPMAFFAPWLKLDFAYVPMLLTGFSMGFVPGLIVLAVKDLFQLLTTNTAGIGQLADMLMGVSLLLPATLLYRHTRRTALIGMLVGMVTMTIVAVLSNVYILLPLYGMGDYISQHPTFILASLIPFNLLKAGAVCLITYLLYKPLSPFLKKGMKV